MKINNNIKIVFYTISFFALLAVFGTSIYISSQNDNISQTESLNGTIISLDNDYLTVEDSSGIEYIFNSENVKASLGDEITIDYVGTLNQNKTVQEVEVVSYQILTLKTNALPSQYQDNGIFSNYYNLAYTKLKELTLDEKIGQLLLVRYPDSNQKEELKKYGFSGYVFFEKDFRNKTKKEVQDMMSSLQEVSKIPILTAVDEEGGTVVRISSNANLVSSPFKSSQELYNAGGFAKISTDTKEKSRILKELGLNVNLAPVVDVSTNPSDYMYPRTICENTSITSTYAKTVIEASKGTGVSYTLKHFPGYGNNTDTHTGSSTDTRTLNDIQTNDLPPFESGIKAGAEAVLVSHNIVTSIDPDNPASLSLEVHNLLRNDFNFTGVIITDDLAMGATSGISNATVKAVQAGNNLIITTDYQNSINSLKNAINDGTITEEQIDTLVFRTLAWKYYKGLMFANQK